MANATNVRIPTTTIKIDPRKIKLLELNARYMRHETYMKLVDNIKQDGVLTQIPFGWHLHDDETREPVYTDDGEPVYEVLSGNHRVSAAIDAGLQVIDFQVTDIHLTKDQRTAIQLSHNELTGEDDPAVLKIIYSGIEDISWRVYAGLDDKTLGLLQEVDTTSISEANLKFQVVSMTFLPDELEEAKKVWEEAKKYGSGSTIWTARWAQYDAWLDAVELASRAHGIQSVATGVKVVLDVFNNHLEDLDSGWRSEDGNARKGVRDVNVELVTGSAYVPAQAAATVKRALDRLRSAGKLEKGKEWEVIAGWAESAKD